MPDRLEDRLKNLLALYRQGRLRDMVREGERLARRHPNSADLFNILGAAYASLRQLDQAVASYRRALKIKPDYAEAHNNLGGALNDLGAFDEAVASCRRALKIRPDYAEAHNNLGAAMQRKGAPVEAAASYRRAVEIRPDYAEAHFNLGTALKNQGILDGAVSSYRNAVKVRPDYAEAYYNLGMALSYGGNFDEAVASYRRALEIQPNRATVHSNLGAALMNQGAFEAAAFSFQRVLEILPDNIEAHNNLGVAYSAMKQFKAAVASYRRALEIEPEFAEAHCNLGDALRSLRALEEAVACYRRALEIRPNHEDARVQKLHLQGHMCDWAGIAEDSASIPELGVEEVAVDPFAMLALEDEPARHRIRSERYAGAKFRRTPLAASPRPPTESRRLRVGYFSADFHVHPITQLMAGVFEAHDRARLEIFAYSHGPDTKDEMRKRVVAAVDCFEDVREISDERIARLARKHGLDIAVDLNGYTKGTRSGIFAYRAAPIQINFLGYPGTLGAPYVDNIIADKTVIPEAQQPHYSESIIYLPDSFFPTSYHFVDDWRERPTAAATRAACGLPEEGIVFCCFNKFYKIGPAEFDIWMRLLAQVEGSALWLSKADRWVKSNLRKEAKARGIDGARLVFADRLPKWSDHLARHRHADLFLDTFNYNAHTTASDALWAGLPLVTKLGRGFAARVGGSLLKAVGLPELITETEADYERLALELATSPVKLAGIKEKLASNRTTAPLFDTALFTRHIEDGYRQAYRLYFEDKPPTTIRVAP